MAQAEKAATADAVPIDDLADPRFPAEVQPVLDAMAAMAPEVRLEPDALIEQATTEAALDDLGDDRFLEALGVLCASLRTEAGLSPGGVVATAAQLVQLLKNRLLVQDLITRHPEIDDEEVARPIVVAGLPRTGTTHLHNLLSADPALRHLPYWESREPVLPEAERPASGEDDPRLARTDQAVAFVDAVMPLFRRMHEMTTDHAHEEIQLLAMDFSTMFFETLAPMPTYRDWYRSTDQTPTYGYLKTVLKVLQWLRGGDRWVLKSPQHLEQFGPLLRTFPDATVVVTHRDPVAVTASMATMLAYAARMHLADVDPHRIGRYWAARGEDLFRACTDDHDLLPADRTVDVRFHELMADEPGTVARIYDAADQPLTDEARAATKGYLASHGRGRHGSIVYDLDDVGLDRDERRRALRFYVERFGVPEES